METKEKEIQYQMRINSIKTLKYSQVDLTSSINVTSNSIEFNSEFKLDIDELKSEIGIRSNVKIRQKGSEIILCELGLLFMVYVVPFNEIVVKNGNNFQIPDAVVENLFVLSAGTIRGVLYEKLKGTVLQNEIYPLLNTKDLIKQVKQS